MRLRLHQVEEQSVLAGADKGKRVFLRLVEQLPLPKSAEILFLDFSEVELASASFLREAVLGLKSWCRGSSSRWFPVIANANADTLAELAIVCELQSDAILACELDANDQVTSIALIGQLEPKQRGAFDFVQGSEGATAKDLMAASQGDRTLSPTAWNNRLNVLVQKGLIMESDGGRTKTFRPLLKEHHRGN